MWKDTSDNSEFDSWSSYLNQVANEGYQVILSSPWYLNYISYGKYNTNTSVEIFDLKDEEGNAAGTKIELVIPM